MAKKVSKLAKKLADPCSRLWRNKADNSWRKVVYASNKGKCVICGTVEHINAHHLVPREILKYRHNPDNGITLCPSHHKYGNILSPHRNPVRFFLWLQKHMPEKWAWLAKTFDPDTGVSLEGSNIPVNYKEAYYRLEGALSERGNASVGPGGTSGSQGA